MSTSLHSLEMVVETVYALARYYVPRVVRKANCCPSETLVHVDKADQSMDVYIGHSPRGSFDHG